MSVEFVNIKKTLNDKGVLLSTEELDTYYQTNIAKEINIDWYRSLFTFGKEAKDYFDTKGGSLASYNGTAYTNNLIFDLDHKDLQRAKEDAVKLLIRLSAEAGLGKEGIQKHVRIYFSGNKGFHVFVKTQKQFTPDELKEYCKLIASDLESFDSKIYNTTRCFRLANTLNPKSNLYKIPLTIQQFKTLSVQEIKNLATKPQDLKDLTTPLENIEIIEKYVALKRAVAKKVPVVYTEVEEVDGIRGLKDIDFRKGKDTPKCIYALSQGIVVPGRGERHEVFLHLGNYYRNQGHDPVVVEAILNGIADLNHRLYPESERFTSSEIKHSIIKMVFSEDAKHNIGGWGVAPENEVFASYCKAIHNGDKCPIHAKHSKKSIIKIDTIADSFTNFASNFEDNIIPTGIKLIDDNVKIAKGTTTLVVGASGCGKTTLCLNALEKLNKQGLKSFFFSLDMHRNLIYMKLAQRYTNYNQDEIFKIFKTQDYKKMQEVREHIKHHFNNTYFDFSGSLSIDDLIQRVGLIEQEEGEKISLVVVDYASRLTGPHSDSNANEAYNALKSKDAADQTDAAWIILNQISRASGDGSTPLRSKRVAKGSSAWEEAASNVLTVWRSFMGLDGVHDAENDVTFNDQYMNLFIAKNRLGPEKEGVLYWDGSRGTVRDLTADENEHYFHEERPKIKVATSFRFASK